MNLSRAEVLKGNYTFPADLIKLHYTNHFKSRLSERGLGLECVPTYLRVTKNNIHSAKTFDNKNLTSVVVKLQYNKGKNIYICFNPFDGGCKTLWFRDANSKKHRKDTKQAVRNSQS